VRIRWSHDREDMRPCLLQHLRDGGVEGEEELGCICRRIASADNLERRDAAIGRQMNPLRRLSNRTDNRRLVGCYTGSCDL
jgi:hypothetical protein